MPMTRPSPVRALARALTLALLTASVATAQETAPDDASPGAAPAVPEIAAPQEIAPEGVESIEVIGEKLDVTDVQDEAQAISSFSMEDLDKLNISSVDGLAANVPGLHVGQVGQAAIITLRGIGTENASLTGESGVAFHVDGIYYGRPSAARVAFFDLQKLDVKRGPQGLLGGKNSTSGSIDVITNDPSDEYEVQGNLLLGNYDRVRARGVINVPLGEYAGFRAAFFHEDRDGYLDNVNFSDSGDPFDADNFGMRTKLRLTPTESLNMVLTYNYFQENGNGPQADLVPIPIRDACRGRPPNRNTVMPRSLACVVQGNPVTGFFFPVKEDDDPRKTFANRRSSQKNRYWGTHGKAIWDTPELPLFGGTTLELRGGYQRTENTFDWDFDGTNLSWFSLDTLGITHEYSSDVRWKGRAFDERLSWQTSLFFMREKGESQTRTPVITSDDRGSISNATLESNQFTENKSYGAALHGELRLSEALTFSLGGRWIKDRKESFLSRIAGDMEVCNGELGRILVGNRSVFPPAPTCAATFRGTSWGSRLEWRPIEDHLIYAGIDRGHKAGGFGLGGTGTYAPEKIWAYTLGSKSEFWDRRVQINLEGFFYAYRDMQIALIDGTSTRTENADTRMWGWELEAEASPIPGLQLRAVVSQLKTETLDYFSLDPASLGDISQDSRLGRRKEAELDHTDFTQLECQNRNAQNVRCGTLGDLAGLDDFSGNQLSRSPEWKITLSAEYEIPLARYGSLTPRVQYTWQDDTYQRAFNREFDLQEKYHKTDLKLIWRSPEGRWDAEIFVQNIEDEAVKDFILIGSRVFSAPPLAWYNEPRFYGVRVGFRY